MSPINERAAAAVGEQVVGSPVERVERLAGSVGNDDFMLITAVGDFVLKASATQDLVAEVWACDRVRRLGVLAPEVVWFEREEPDALPTPFLIMRRLPGVPIAVNAAALMAAGEQLATVHSVRLAGYGELVVQESQARGGDERWASFVRRLAGGLDELVAGQVLTGASAATTARVLRDAAAELSFDAPAVLLHGDLKLAHILADPDGGVALIDWGDACAGDPRLDLGRMSMAGPEAFRLFMSGYGLALTPELQRSLTAYRLLWNLDALTYEFRAGGTWFDSYRAGIRAAADELTQS